MTLHTEATAIRVLDDQQVATFDREYMYEKRWQLIKRCLDRDFPEGRFRIVDVGGGNGLFADRVLAAYPHSQATVLDLAESLLARNAPNPRKHLVHGSATELAKLGQQYDIVFFNWVLHHLVTDSYRGSRATIRATLQQCGDMLAPGGRLSIFENMYDGWPVHGLPGRMVFAVTSARFLAPLARRVGANTAGVGVCFQSEHQWRRHFAAAGFDVRDFARDSPFRIPKFKRLAILAKFVGPGHFWLARN